VLGLGKRVGALGHAIRKLTSARVRILSWERIRIGEGDLGLALAAEQAGSGERIGVRQPAGARQRITGDRVRAA
jgi:hypothetical protein